MLLAVATALSWPAGVRGMDPDRRLSQYLRDRWEKADGYAAGPVYGITQTRDGYLWIAAEKGIVRFDGLRFRLFQPLQPTATTDTAALSVLPDPQGGLWTWLRRSALMRLDNGVFENAFQTPGLPELRAGMMVPGNDASILIVDTRFGLQAWRAGHLETLLTRDALPRQFVTAIAQTPDGDIWLGTHHAGLVRVQNGRATSLAETLPSQVNCLVADGRNGLWIGTDSGIYRWDGAHLSRASSTPETNAVRALTMIKDRDGNVWVGSATGLVRIDAHGGAAFEARGTSAAVTALFEDREGNLWIGDANGVERWRDGAFASYAPLDPGLAGSIGPVFVDTRDRVWFAPLAGGLFWLRDGHVGTVAALRDDVVYSIAGDADGVVVGRQRGGLTRVRPQGDAGPFTIETFTERDGLSQNQVFAVQRARDGTVWAATISGGASRLEGNSFTTFTTRDGLASNSIASIVEAADGAMWFATPNGISVRSRDGWRRLSTADGLPSNDVNTLFEDSARIMWIGTAAGLALARDGRVSALPPAPPALRASILGLAEDRAGGLWIATTDHLLRVQRERLSGSSIGSTDIREFTAADGLPDTETIKRHRVLMTDSRGRIWLSTAEGLVMADGGRVASDVAPALVQVEDIAADGNAVDQSQDRMTIPPRPDRITLGFAGLSLSVPARVRFRYRLDGFDHDWSEPVTERQAVFTNLGPGPYRFRVIASNSEGLWNSAEASVAFTIAPAWFQRYSFWAAVVVLVTAAAWASYRARLRQLARQLDVRFEERLSERFRIARELHDTLLQSFQGAVLRFRAVTYMLPDRPDEARITLESAIDDARRALVEGRDAVQGLRSPVSATGNLASAIATLADTLAGNDGSPPPLFQVNVEGTARDLTPLVHDETYKIAGEALRNAFRHAQASRIEVEIRYDQRRFRLRVRDDGKGINPTPAAGGRTDEGHYGMAGMQERAKLIGGSLSVWSELESGTEMELTIPASVAYAKSAAI